jgi:hypothetical protein
MITFKLNNGLTVLAKQDKYGINPYTYANHKQANNKRNELQSQGIKCHIGGIRPIFIIIEEAKP